jgi:hypothetical protein
MIRLLFIAGNAQFPEEFYRWFESIPFEGEAPIPHCLGGKGVGGENFSIEVDKTQWECIEDARPGELENLYILQVVTYPNKVGGLKHIQTIPGRISKKQETNLSLMMTSGASAQSILAPGETLKPLRS